MYPEKGLKAWFRDLGLALLALLLLQIYTCELHGQDLIPLGMTTCDSLGNPQISIRKELIGTPMGARVIAHEMIHVGQMQKHKDGCRGATAHYRADPDFRFRQELEAYCFDISKDDNYPIEVDILAINMFNRYGEGKTYPEAKRIVNEECTRQRR